MRLLRVLFGLDDLEQEYGFTEGVEEQWLEHVLLTGVERFPWWGELGIDRKGSWWGYYGVSPDNSPIIGFNPGAQAWIDACGFSGHGIMHAPADELIRVLGHRLRLLGASAPGCGRRGPSLVLDLGGGHNITPIRRRLEPR
jgi:hypothetical protein